MKRYAVVLTKSAEKNLYKLPVKIITRIVELLKSLEENPRVKEQSYYSIPLKQDLKDKFILKFYESHKSHKSHKIVVQTRHMEES